MPALQKLLGPGAEDLLSSGDAVQDKADRNDFVARYQQKHSLEPNGDDAMTLIVGDNDWPMPIPIVKKDGKWHLDGAAGADEIVYRRVGANELGAIDVSLRLRRCTERVRGRRSRRRSGRHLRAQADQRRGHAQRPLLADG